MATQQENQLSTYLHNDRLTIDELVELNIIQPIIDQHAGEIRELALNISPTTMPVINRLARLVASSTILQSLVLYRPSYEVAIRDTIQKVDVLCQAAMQSRSIKSLRLRDCRPSVQVAGQLLASELFDQLETLIVASWRGLQLFRDDHGTMFRSDIVPFRKTSVSIGFGSSDQMRQSDTIDIECSPPDVFALIGACRHSITEMSFRYQEEQTREDLVLLTVAQTAELVTRQPLLTDISCDFALEPEEEVSLNPLVEALARKNSVQKTSLSHGYLDAADIVGLTNTSLRDLELQSMTLRSSEPLSWFQGLEKLRLYNCLRVEPDVNWEPIFSLASLKSLTLDQDETSLSEGIAVALATSIRNGKRFEYLDLRSNLHPGLWDAISAHSKNINWLYIMCRVSHSHLTMMRSLAAMSGPTTITVRPSVYHSSLLLEAVKQNTGIHFVESTVLLLCEQRSALYFWLLRNRCLALEASGMLSNRGLWADIFRLALNFNFDDETCPSLVYYQLRAEPELFGRRGLQRERDE